MSGVRVTTLPNGLRVATDPMPGVQTASVGVWIGVGSRHEPEAANGVAHLVEHMLFKGTDRRDAFRISAEIEDVGGHLNAYTGREHTTYYAKVLKEDVALALDLLADMIQHSRFDPADLDKERQVVIQEIGQAEDTPDDIIYDHWLATAFRGQALGRPILGTAEVVAALPREALTGYVAANYTAANMVVAAAGNVEHDRVVDLVARLFGGLPAGTAQSAVRVDWNGGDFREDRDLEQLHILLGFDGVPLPDPDYYASQVLSTLLGGGMSSRLFQEVREKRGLVYSVHSFAWPMTDAGVFGIYAGTGPERTEELVPVVCDQVRAIANGLSPEEVTRARAQLKASQLMSLESTTNRAEQLAHALLVFDRPVPPEEIIARVDAVDADALRRVAARIFGSRPVLAALGPIGRLEPYERLAARLA
ncbi:M16 family metallopeptidase [Rhodospirillum centenum]|uniref:Peptidase, M16 family n=1 Tax=Rhodospirillum centenum (strain ATCC 51521 / SW) TaxID=414684 RepID=B6IXG8_RHOCS|nr:pitrilysin family protein [Rhodospirillum centenum]ACJ00992.1 Peptidase, M16 family [Rhodospirillum centenum SW]